MSRGNNYSFALLTNRWDPNRRFQSWAQVLAIELVIWWRKPIHLTVSQPRASQMPPWSKKRRFREHSSKNPSTMSVWRNNWKFDWLYSGNEPASMQAYRASRLVQPTTPYPGKAVESFPRPDYCASFWGLKLENSRFPVRYVFHPFF